jgi:hypothetical protein
LVSKAKVSEFCFNNRLRKAAFVVAKAMAIFEKKFDLNKNYTIIALPTCKPMS